MGFAAALALPETLKDPVKGPSQEPRDAAWSAAMGTDLSYFEFLHQQVPVSQASMKVAGRGDTNGSSKPEDATLDEKLVTRGDTEMYNMALASYSRSRGRAPLYDFPWGELGDGLVVDVGGGVGKFLDRPFPVLIRGCVVAFNNTC